MSDPLEEPAAPPTSGHWRNLLVIAVIYAYVAIVVLGALWFFRWREGRVHWWTDFPVAFLAITLIGPAQHRLLLLGHDACMGCLFRNRWLNELAGDWLTHFPFSLATHQMRHIVRSHYEFPNDPERDAERIIAERAGFWPLKPGRLLRLTSLLRWQSLRANFNFLPDPKNPYQEPGKPPSKVAVQIGTGYVLVMFAILIGLYLSPNWWVLVIVPPSMWVLTCVVFLLLPGRFFHHSRLKPVYSPRFRTLMQITFITLVNLGLGWSSYLTGRSAILNYIALWIAPMVTTCAWGMLWRQWRQHGQGDVTDQPANRLQRLLVFPLNQRLHRTRHEFPDSAWYDLPKLAQNPPGIVDPNPRPGV